MIIEMHANIKLVVFNHDTGPAVAIMRQNGVRLEEICPGIGMYECSLSYSWHHTGGLIFKASLSVTVFLSSSCRMLKFI